MNERPIRRAWTDPSRWQRGHVRIVNPYSGTCLLCTNSTKVKAKIVQFKPKGMVIADLYIRKFHGDIGVGYKIFREESD